MTKSRYEQVSVSQTPFYHCMVRCVRRAFLCGEDVVSGRNFDHRKQWLVSRLRFLSYVYAIDVCAYAIMSNHYHVVLHVDEARVALWSDKEVVERWLQLYKGNVLVDRWLQDADSMSKAELDKVAEVIALWRERLTSISWFMRGVNETIARMANEEDQCTGRFWEGRFKSQALLDEGALLTCMAYVDLNPVRAGMAEDIISSDFTAIQQRLFDHVERQKEEESTVEPSPLNTCIMHQQETKDALGLADLPAAELMRFDGSSHTSIHRALPFTWVDYIDLVNSTGRVIREDKRGFIPEQSQRLIARLGLDPEHWVEHILSLERCYGDCVGSRERMREFSACFNRRWSKGIASAGVCALKAA